MVPSQERIYFIFCFIFVRRSTSAIENLTLKSFSGKNEGFGNLKIFSLMHTRRATYSPVLILNRVKAELIGSSKRRHLIVRDRRKRRKLNDVSVVIIVPAEKDDERNIEEEQTTVHERVEAC